MKTKKWSKIVRHNCEFVITVIVIIEFECIFFNDCQIYKIIPVFVFQLGQKRDFDSARESILNILTYSEHEYLIF
jgi:hypothetical protein